MTEGPPLAATPDFQPRAVSGGDEAPILELFAHAFGHPRSLAHWRWKYERNPWGNRCVSVTLAPDGRLAAHYAGYPVPWRVYRRGAHHDFEALHIGDTMTARPFRHVGRGRSSLLGRTVEHFYATYCADRVAFNYGFNTANIQKFSLLFVGARRVADVSFRVLDLNGRRPAGRRWLDPYRVEATTRVDEEWSDFLTRAGPAYGLLVRRDADYVRWRYLDCPDAVHRVWAARRRGRLVGWAAFRRAGADLVWGDALVEPGEEGAMRPILDSALASEWSRGAEPPRRVVGWFSPHPDWWSRWLEAEGFRLDPEPNHLALMCVPFRERDAENLLAGCYYTQGDGDLF